VSDEATFLAAYKDYSDQQWCRLIACNTSTDEFSKNETWAGCPGPETHYPTDITKGCKCNDLILAPFIDYRTLVSTACFPGSFGGVLLFIKGYSTLTVSARPTQIPASPDTALMLTNTLDTSSTSPFGPETTTSPADNNILSIGAKAGIGAGTTVIDSILFVILRYVWRI
jgi:hypothetical protein